MHGTFFQKNVETPKKSDFINLHHQLFRAVAITLLHEMKAKLLNHALLKSTLDSFYQQYPEYRPKAPYLSAKEDSQASLNSLMTVVFAEQPSKLIDCFASMLQNCAVTGMLKDPAQFIEIFEQFTPQTAIAHLREPSTEFPPEALNGLIKELNFIEIKLTITESDKKLPGSALYTDQETDGPKINLPLYYHNKNYFVENHNLRGVM
jgi:hypothetical protein